MAVGPYAALVGSGGKDSTLALDRARGAGLDVRWLVNLYEASSGRVRFHGVRAELVARQADALGLSCVQRAVGPEGFEAAFHSALDAVAASGARVVVFGNIHLQDVRAWYEERTRARGLEHVEPLWGEPPGELVREFVRRGYRAVVTSVNLSQGRPEWVGAQLDLAFVRAVEARGADPCGEAGEYHTFVYDGPGFRFPVRFRLGAVSERDGHRFVDLEPDEG